MNCDSKLLCDLSVPIENIPGATDLFLVVDESNDDHTYVMMRGLPYD